MTLMRVMTYVWLLVALLCIVLDVNTDTPIICSVICAAAAAIERRLRQ